MVDRQFLAARMVAATRRRLAPPSLVPVVAARRHDQRSLLAVLVTLASAGFLGLLVAPGAAVVWMVVLGVG